MSLLKEYLEYEKENNSEFNNFSIFNEEFFSIVGYRKKVLDLYDFRYSTTFFDMDNTISIIIGYSDIKFMNRGMLLESINTFNASDATSCMYISKEGELCINQLLYEKSDIKEVIAYTYHLEEKLFKKVFELRKELF